MNEPQNFQNHTRMDPLYHYFLMPVAFVSLVLAIVNVIRSPSLSTIWGLLIAMALGAIVAKVRLYPLRVQDRLIRLEERLRLATLVADPYRARIGELNEGQLVALRFACDAEIPALVEKALAANLKPREIKQSIVNWRPDYFRV